MGKVAAIGICAAAFLLLPGCRKVYMVPTPEGWTEMRATREGNVMIAPPSAPVVPAPAERGSEEMTVVH